MLFIVAAAITFGSCSKENEQGNKSNFPADGVIRVVTTVNDPLSRAGATTANTSQFGLCVTNAASTTYSYQNVQMTKSQDGWTSAATMLWQSDSQPVDIVAYAPYQSGANYSTLSSAVIANVEADQSTAENVIKSDFLAQKQASFQPSSDLVAGKVPVALKHLMSKVNISLSLGNEFNLGGIPAANPISTVMVNGVRPKGVCNFAVQTLNVTSAGGDNAVTVNPFFVSYTKATAATSNGQAVYECILVPQQVAANGFSVVVTINDRDYVWTSKNVVNLDSGYLYTLKLAVGKDITEVGDITSSEWGEGTGGSLETE